MEPTESDFLESLFMVPREVPVAVLRTVLDLIYDIKISGFENIPKTGGAVLISNHTDYLDVVVQGAYADRKIVYLGKYELFHPQEDILKIINHPASPFQFPPLSFAKPLMENTLNLLGTLYKKNLISWGSMPIIRNAVNESEMTKKDAMQYYEQLENYMVDLLKAGEVISIYPEGTRTASGEMASFKALPAKIAIRAGVPIIPSGIGGAWKMSTPEAFFTGKAFRAKIRYTIGKPIQPQDFPTGAEKKAAKDLTEVLEKQVEMLVKISK